MEQVKVVRARLAVQSLHYRTAVPMLSRSRTPIKFKLDIPDKVTTSYLILNSKNHLL